ncbi:phosphohistidine phosphatase SixA [Gallaecimonas kandeliae]|uniref:phosphohistidine phosphatase SixA n=1 Tax=Gallaecimonas kandeliae TaxID=3029055 RepID=UPI0026479B27|nr:phosphohistidine phosphatase SixA [Gallaecimonas kandeliae]WKE64173.1 phosphohistidine phosphatase SixA [Gallaecimonas kandeliae]
MQILVMRHGEAEPQIARDAERRLTEYGQHQALAQGQWLKSQGWQPDALWVSTYLRAQQTADQVVAGLGLAPPRLVLPELVPAGDIEAVADLLAGSPELKRVLIVSHMPLVSYLVERLVPGEMPMAFATAQIVVIDIEDGKASISLRQFSSVD